MKNYKEVKDKKILILGFSTTGIASAKYFIKEGANVYMSEYSPMNNNDAKKVEELKNMGIKIEFSGHSDDFIKDSYFCILSPSIPCESEVLKKLDNNNIEYFSDIEYFSFFEQRKMIITTGTNGKTTTTALVSHVLSGKYFTP